MHNYHAAYNCFPPAYVADRNGKPMHSWRVLLLPYMEQDGLYRQYRFDEPWDSPHNRVLAGVMPSVYRCPSDPAQAGSTTTRYVVVTGPGTVFDGAKCATMAEIRDGTSNTLLMIESPASPVNWMEPQDITADELSQTAGPATSGPGSSGGSPHVGGVNAALCDGSVRFISRSIDAQTLKLLSQKSDGQAIDPGGF
jgi:prepilin-type processing-associated H-X9-DG protein